MTAAAPVVHVVDDDPSFRTAVVRLLRAAGYQVALYQSGDELLANAPVVEPGCILLDVQMSGMSGLERQHRLSERQCILPLVFLTGHGDITTSLQAVKGGAEDFLSKPVSKRTLFEAIDGALARYRERRDRRDRIDDLHALFATLTPREHEVFALVARGKLNKQIAFALGTSERTVKAHRHTVMEKLKVRSLAEAVAIAARIGQLTLPTGGENT
jgi:FixJ family two-component response regulator